MKKLLGVVVAATVLVGLLAADSLAGTQTRSRTQICDPTCDQTQTQTQSWIRQQLQDLSCTIADSVNRTEAGECQGDCDRDRLNDPDCDGEGDQVRDQTRLRLQDCDPEEEALMMWLFGE